MGASGVGMPADMKLHEFGSMVWEAFGSPPYLVGSALKTTKWRDVDVRMILSDEEWERLDLGDPDRARQTSRWHAFCRAFSVLGKEMTGLPIDFQLQQESYANKLFPTKDGHPRSGLGNVPWRMRKATAETEDRASVLPPA